MNPRYFAAVAAAMRVQLLVLCLVYALACVADAFTAGRLGNGPLLLVKHRRPADLLPTTATSAMLAMRRSRLQQRQPCHVLAAYAADTAGQQSLAIPPVALPKVPYSAEGSSKWVDIFQRLYRERIIFLGQELNDHVASHVIATMMYLDNEDYRQPIYLYINSPGGSVVSGLAIYDAMQQTKSEIVTINIGLAGSMGSLLLAGGTLGRRYALAHSRIFLHEPEPADYGVLQEMPGMGEQLQRLRSSVLQIYSDATARPIEQVEQDLKMEKYLSAQEALQYGVIDDIVVSDPLNSGLTSSRAPAATSEFKDFRPPGSRPSKTERFEIQRPE